jgi:glycosyltransferase involved in cell wall biosynthesis
MRVAIVPALNEAPRIARVITTMPSVIDRILVVDDGSTDETARVARATFDPRVEVLVHGSRLGVGAAIATGALRARELGAATAVVMAGDGQMDPADLPALLGPVLRGEADLVKGNRLAWPGGALAFPRTRLVGVVALAAATRVATGLPIDDAQCGYVAFGRHALDRVPWRDLWPSFGYPNDLLGHAARLDLRVAEVPVRPVYEGEESKLRPRHAPAIAWVIGRAFVRRISARAPAYRAC